MSTDDWTVDRHDDAEEFLIAAQRALAHAHAMARLRAIAVIKHRLPEVERDAVAQAVASGLSWGLIGDGLGVSRQAAHAKHTAETPTAGSPRRKAKVDYWAWFDSVRRNQERVVEQLIAQRERHRT